jgi:hypothetical protein
VLISEKPRRGPAVSFGWDHDDTGLYDLLAKNSVLFDLRLLTVLEESQLGSYAAVVLPASVELTPWQTEMLRRYKSKGGRIYVLGSEGERASLATVSSPDAVFRDLPGSAASQKEILEKLRSLAPDALSLSVAGAPHVLGNITRLGSKKGLAIHLLNYAPAPVSGVRVRVNLDQEFRPLAGAQPRLVTPDGATGGIGPLRRASSAVEFTLNILDNYAVVVLE